MPPQDQGARRVASQPRHDDPLHDLQLRRDLEIINECTAHELGPLLADGLSVQTRRKPQLPRPTVAALTPIPPASEEDSTMQWKSMVLATLATAGTLASCGAEGTAARVDTPAVAVPHAPVSPKAEPPAAGTTTTTSTGGGGAKASEPARGPAIPAAELRKRIIDLIGSFQSLKDLEREHVEQVLQMPLRKDPEMRMGYESDGKTTEGWGYGVSVGKLDRLDQPSTILIGLDSGVEPWTDQKPTYCTLEFEPLAKELVAMGYERDTRMSTLGSKPSWGFGRDSKANNAGFGIGIYIYELEAIDGTKRTCIMSFDIGGGAIDG